MKNSHICEISLEIPKKIKEVPQLRKYQEFLNSGHCMSNQDLQKRADKFFPKFSRKVFFFTLITLFLRSPYGSTTFKIWLKLDIIQDITKAFPPPLPIKLIYPNWFSDCSRTTGIFYNVYRSCLSLISIL